jgi:protein SCO1/2
MTLKNKYGLFWVIGSLITIALLSVGCQFLSNYEYKGTVIDPPIPLPDFELTTTAGQPFHLSDVAGDIALIYFGYTYCPDVCPLTMGDVKKALAGLETGRERVHVIFISIDPERDTPEVLANYMKAFGPEFIGLTDDFAKVQEVMKPYGAFAQKEEVEDSALGYSMSHTARLYLVDPQRRMFLQYTFGFEAEDLRSDLAHLLQEEGL